MPLNLSTPAIVTPAADAVTATQFDAIQIVAGVSPLFPDSHGLTVIYAAGNVDANGNFVQVGANRQAVLSSADFSALLAAAPDVQAAVKNMALGVIAKAEGVTGTIS